MTGSIRPLLSAATVAAGVTAAGYASYVGLVTGACPLDLGIGRRARPLGPQPLPPASNRHRSRSPIRGTLRSLAR